MVGLWGVMELKLSCCELLVVSIVFSLQFCRSCFVCCLFCLVLEFVLVGLGFVFWIAVEVP